jgi:hypothetical protein
MSIVLVGSTSGSVTLQEPAVAGTTVIDLPATSGTMVVTGGAQTVQFAAGSASTPSITFTGDTNTGIFSPGADTIAFTEGGTEVARFDSAGNLGIGANPQTGVKLDVFSTSANEVISRSSDTTSYANFIVDVNNVTTQRMQMVSFGSTASGTLLGISRANNSFLAKSGGVLAVGTRDTNVLVFGVNETERMRLNSSGTLFIGATSSPSGTQRLVLTADGNAGTEPLLINELRAGSSTENSIRFYRNGSQVGTITTNASNTSYNTSSDYRLKENIAPMTGALAKVQQLKPCTYTWKVDGSAGQGFIAHELQAVVPNCVTGEKDAVDKNGNPEYQGIDTSFLVATLTAALQEQQAIITDLKARIETLENK